MNLSAPIQNKSVIQRLALFTQDLPKLARLVGHLALLLLLFLLSRDIRPYAFPKLIVGRASYAQSIPTDLLEYSYYFAPNSFSSASSVSQASNPRFLEQGVVPVTFRTLNGVRDVLPLRLPQRTVRTSVLIYQVQSGDTVLGIAEKFGLQGNSILWANDKLAENPDFLQVGQELNILPVDGAYHTVAKGDTIASIAKQYKVEESAITSYKGNGLEPPYNLTAGQKLIIPGGVKPYVPKRVEVYTGAVPSSAKRGSGAFVWPISGKLSQTFWQGHTAIDIAAPSGSRVVAADAGYVAYVQYSNTGYGRMVLIDHGNGYKTRYAHLSVIQVEVGQSVTRGQQIGLSGSTGNSTGPHLHFEIIRNNVCVNPLSYLP